MSCRRKLQDLWQFLDRFRLISASRIVICITEGKTKTTPKERKRGLADWCKSIPKSTHLSASAWCWGNTSTILSTHNQFLKQWLSIWVTQSMKGKWKGQFRHASQKQTKSGELKPATYRPWLCVSARAWQTPVLASSTPVFLPSGFLQPPPTSSPPKELEKGGEQTLSKWRARKTAPERSLHRHWRTPKTG